MHYLRSSSAQQLCARYPFRWKAPSHVHSAYVNGATRGRPALGSLRSQGPRAREPSQNCAGGGAPPPAERVACARGYLLAVAGSGTARSKKGRSRACAREAREMRAGGREPRTTAARTATEGRGVPSHGGSQALEPAELQGGREEKT